MNARCKVLLWIVPAAVVVSCLSAIASFRSEPTGYFDGYAVSLHATYDVLDFREGVVTLRTCCGDESWGTYARSPDGAWIWSRHHPSWNEAVEEEFRVEPGIFTVKLTLPASTTHRAFRLTLRRRLSLSHWF